MTKPQNTTVFWGFFVSTNLMPLQSRLSSSDLMWKSQNEKRPAFLLTFLMWRGDWDEYGHLEVIENIDNILKDLNRNEPTK